MTVWGADTDALDHLAITFDNNAEMIKSHRARINHAIHTAPWHGANADRFRDNWNRDYMRSLLAAADSLHEAASILRRNAAEQRSASGGSTSSGGIGAVLTVGAGVVGAVAHGSHGWLPNLMHDARHAWDQAAHVAHEVVVSPQFDIIVSSSHTIASVLATAAPLVLLAGPELAPLSGALLAAAAVSQAVYVGGTAAQMANGAKPFNAMTLVEGGVELAVDVVGAGAASGSGGLLREAANATNASGVNHIPISQVEGIVKAFPDISVQSAMRLTTALDVAHTAISEWQDGQALIHDVQSGDYSSAVIDGVKSGLDLAGVVSDTDLAKVVDASTTLVDVATPETPSSSPNTDGSGVW